MFGLFKPKALEDIASAASSKATMGRRGFLYTLPVLAAGAACCDDGSSGGKNKPGPVPDTTPPSSIDLYAYASTQNGEEVNLVWQSPGDDGLEGTPEFFVIKYSANPINTETDWNNATDIGSINQEGPVGTNYDKMLPVPKGDWYFAIKTSDEAGNLSDVSAYPQGAPITIQSKAEFYVDKWLPMDNTVHLNYAEAVAMIQGEGSIPSYVSEVATELMKSTPAYPGTQAQLENNLLLVTDGDFTEELHVGFDPFQLDDDNIGTKKVRLYFAPDGTNINDFDNLPPTAVQNLRDILKLFLEQYVDAHPGDYGNLDPGHNPTWTQG